MLQCFCIVFAFFLQYLHNFGDLSHLWSHCCRFFRSIFVPFLDPLFLHSNRILDLALFALGFAFKPQLKYFHDFIELADRGFHNACSTNTTTTSKL